jgi:hypothetical protein
MEMLVRIQVGGLYPPVDEPLNLCGEFGSYGVSNVWTGQTEHRQYRNRSLEAALGIDEHVQTPVVRKGDTVGQIEMDPYAKKIEPPGRFDGGFGGGHIHHQCRAGQHAVFVGLGYGAVYAVTEAKIVCIYYQSPVHGARV